MSDGQAGQLVLILLGLCLCCDPARAGVLRVSSRGHRDTVQPGLPASSHCPGLRHDLRVPLTVSRDPDLLTMFLSCCCRAQKDSKKRKKSSGSGSGPAVSVSLVSGTDSVSPEPGSQPARLVFSPHSPIFTIQSNNVQSSSLSSEDFYYYQVHSKALIFYAEFRQNIYLKLRRELKKN